MAEQPDSFINNGTFRLQSLPSAPDEQFLSIIVSTMGGGVY
jgi:hypothetical protein